MPCDSIQTVEVALGKLNKKLLDEAMRELGYYGYVYDGQTVTLRTGRQVDAKEIKRAYSKRVVFSQAKKYGWQVKEVGKDQWEVVRR